MGALRYEDKQIIHTITPMYVNTCTYALNREWDKGTWVTHLRCALLQGTQAEAT